VRYQMNTTTGSTAGVSGARKRRRSSILSASGDLHS
jgi:hypothetical protein